MLDFTYLAYFKTNVRGGADPDKQVCDFVKSLNKKIVIKAILAPAQNSRILYYEPDSSDSKIPVPVQGMDKDIRNVQLGGNLSKVNTGIKNKVVNEKINLREVQK